MPSSSAVKPAKKAKRAAKEADSTPSSTGKRKSGDAAGKTPSAKKAKRELKQEPSPAIDQESGSEETEETPRALADDDREGDELALQNFRLSGETLAALEKRGVKALFPIQAATFDLIFEGKDMIGRARTGMGKTLAFALPIVERIRAKAIIPADEAASFAIGLKLFTETMLRHRKHPLFAELQPHIGTFMKTLKALP